MQTNALAELTNQLEANKVALKSILDAGNDLTQEKLEEGKALKAKIDDIKSRIDGLRNLSDAYAETEAYLKEPVRGVPFSTLGSTPAGEAEVDMKSGEVVWEDGPGVLGHDAWKAINSPEYKSALRDYLRLPQRKISAKAMKTLEAGTDDQGGFTVPVDWLNRVIQRKPTPTRVAGMVTNINTSREFVEMMKVNYATDNIYSTGFRVTKTGENPSSATAARVTDTNLFGTIKIPVHTFMITGLITNNMIEDSALNILQWVQSKFEETIDILKDDKIVNGTGVMEPRGLVGMYAASADGGGLNDPKISFIKSGNSSALTADGIITLAEDIPEQYDENCKYLFNKTSTHKAIRLLKDSQNRYLFGYGYQDSGLRQAGRPTDLNGYPYVWSGLMPSVAANAYPICFGDFSGYTLVNRVAFSIQVLRELYAELNQVALVGRIRFGGQVTEPWKLRLQKVAA